MKPKEKRGIRSRIGPAMHFLLSGALPGEPDPDMAEVNTSLANLEMDIADRDKTIAVLKKEYDLLKNQAEADASMVADEALKDMVKKLAPLLSQVVTMRAVEQSGIEIKSKDLLKLFEKVEKAVCECGVEQIGSVGEEILFDVKIHQRLSGGSIRDGDNVKVRFAGYKFNGAIVKKAMVSKEDQT